MVDEMDEINRFIQKPMDGECPKWETRQYTHPIYGLLEVSVNKCESEDVETEFNEKLANLLESIETMNETSNEEIEVECEDGSKMRV